VARRPSETVFQAYGIPSEDIPDPIARALNGLLDEVTTLRARVAELENQERVRIDGDGEAPELQIGNGADDQERVA